MRNKTRPLLFWGSLVLLVVPGLVHAYLLMPFPGSQDLNAITVSYYLEKIVFPLRLIAAALIIWYLIRYFSTNSIRAKIVKIFVLAACIASFYFTDFMFKAETMFEEPRTIKFTNAINNKVPESLVVIGVVINGVAKAYPLIYLAYHHKIEDNVGNKPVLITYCSMCRTGRVYNPVINGLLQSFRLVGARHYNAIIEDNSTKTWWYQATGYAAVGKLKGSQLQELPYEQASLSAWLNKHPGSLILQPDKHYLNDYEDLKNYDRLQAVDKDSTLKNKDTLIRKSWVLGVIINKQAKAYDWRQLLKKHLLNDQINQSPVLMVIEKDSVNFHAFSTVINKKRLHFKLDTAGVLSDKETASLWNLDGLCTSGILKNNHLRKIQVYQEYWHSWKHFHPNTLFWKEKTE